MKGIVLGYDTDAEAVVLRAEDGKRYRVSLNDWRDRQSPRKGDEVDFEPDGARARDVYAVTPKQHVDATSVTPLSVVAGWAPARFFLTRPVLTCAILVLLACMTGAYSIGDTRISVFEAPDLIGRMSEALDSLISASGTDPAPRLGAGIVRILLVLLLGLYLVPVLAGVTIWREFIGRPNRDLARYAGIAAIVLPIALPLLIALVVQIWVLPGIPEVGVRLGRSGVTTPQQVFELLRLYATGTVLLIFSGGALWAAATGRLSVSLDVRQAAEPAREPVRSRPRSRPDFFAPLRARREAASKRTEAKSATSKPAPIPPKPVHPASSLSERSLSERSLSEPSEPAPASFSPAAPPPMQPAPVQPESVQSAPMRSAPIQEVSPAASQSRERLDGADSDLVPNLKLGSHRDEPTSALQSVDRDPAGVSTASKSALETDAAPAEGASSEPPPESDIEADLKTALKTALDSDLPTTPPEFLKVGAAADPGLNDGDPSDSGPINTGRDENTGGKSSKDVLPHAAEQASPISMETKVLDDAELPPRSGSVWPEPIAASDPPPSEEAPRGEDQQQPKTASRSDTAPKKSGSRRGEKGGKKR